MAQLVPVVTLGKVQLAISHISQIHTLQLYSLHSFGSWHPRATIELRHSDGWASALDQQWQGTEGAHKIGKTQRSAR